MRRLEALGGFLTGEIHLLAVPADAAMHRLMPRARFMEGMIDVEEGQRLEPSELIERLIRAGYERVELVEARGQCALRGVRPPRRRRIKKPRQHQRAENAVHAITPSKV